MIIKINSKSESNKFWENLNEVFDILFSLKRMWLYSFKRESEIDGIEVPKGLGERIKRWFSGIDGFEENPLIFDEGDKDE